MFVKLDCNNVFFVCLFNYVKNKKQKKEKKKVKNNKTPPLSGSGQCACNFSRSEGKKNGFWVFDYFLKIIGHKLRRRKTKSQKIKVRETIAI